MKLINERSHNIDTAAISDTAAALEAERALFNHTR